MMRVKKEQTCKAEYKKGCGDNKRETAAAKQQYTGQSCQKMKQPVCP